MLNTSRLISTILVFYARLMNYKLPRFSPDSKTTFLHSKAVTEAVNIPVIASGGAGSIQHFIDVFKNTGADAALAASIFHFGEIAIRDVKFELKKEEIPVRIEKNKS